MKRAALENWIWIVGPIVVVALGIAVYTMIERSRASASLMGLGYS